ncbi:MAG TPA: hypothetical protein VE030_11075 [Burkholderiales bacterium]|nr:hypothetical protein [Burkholderiales bacterium]
MSANSCIAAARTTIETMRLYRLRAVEKPVCYVFQVPARNYARLAGFSAEERAEMKAKAGNWVDATPDGGSWNGHLIVVVEDRWILDPSIDQADAPQFGVSVPAEVFVADTLGQTWHPNMNFEIELGLILDNGDAASLLYHSISDRGYLETEAWTDEGLPLLAHAIASEMKNAAAVSIACPKCGRVSHNANDVRERYCGNCHSFHDDAR